MQRSIETIGIGRAVQTEIDWNLLSRGDHCDHGHSARTLRRVPRFKKDKGRRALEKRIARLQRDVADVESDIKWLTRDWRAIAEATRKILSAPDNAATDAHRNARTLFALTGLKIENARDKRDALLRELYRLAKSCWGLRRYWPISEVRPDAPPCGGWRW